jgi:hypothetical protein
MDAYPNLGSAAQLERAVADAEAVGDKLLSLGFRVTRDHRSATASTDVLEVPDGAALCVQACLRHVKHRNGRSTVVDLRGVAVSWSSVPWTRWVSYRSCRIGDLLDAVSGVGVGGVVGREVQIGDG